MDLALEIESKTGRQMAFVDIGGGLSTSYKEAVEPEEATTSTLHNSRSYSNNLPHNSNNSNLEQEQEEE